MIWRLVKSMLPGPALVLLAACRAAPAVEGGSLRSLPPLPYVICLVPPEVPGAGAAGATAGGEAAHGALAAAGPEEQAASPQNILPIDAERLEEALRAAFKEFGVCTHFEVLPRAAGGRKAVLAEARGRGADLLVEVESIGLPAYRFARQSAWFVPNTAVWFLLGFPSFWVRDRVYEVTWKVRFRVHSLAAAKELTGEGLILLLREERPLNLLERGWTATALYTPPGLYEGPAAARSLSPVAEAWLVRELVGFLKSESEAPSLPFDVEIVLDSPRNLAVVSSGEVAVRVSVRSPTPLELLRVELDGHLLLERNPLNMLRPAKLDGERFYELPPLELRAAAGEHRLRVLARRSGERPGRSPDEPVWSASKTIGFVVARAAGGG